MMTRRTFNRLAASVLMMAILASPIGVVKLQAGPAATVGLTVSNSINSQIPAEMVLRINGQRVAHGEISAGKLLWSGNILRGARVQLRVTWNGTTKRKELNVTRHGTRMAPKLVTPKRFEIVATPQ